MNDAKLMDCVIRCTNLAKTYREGELVTPVFEGLELSVARGETVAIVGASGAGKSTLLHLLGGLDSATSGEVIVDGQTISALPEKARGLLRNRALGFIYQFHHLLPEFSALENVMMPMRKLGQLTPAAMEDRARSLLHSVGLGEKTHRLGTQLSGGEQQRVAVARALANQPSIILADEPTGNLDVKNSGMVFDLLTRLAKENGQAVILVTHNPEIAQRCDVTRPMRDGVFV